MLAILKESSKGSQSQFFHMTPTQVGWGYLNPYNTCLSHINHYIHIHLRNIYFPKIHLWVEPNYFFPVCQDKKRN